MKEPREVIIERYMRDTEHKANSLYNSGLREGAETATQGAYEMGMVDAWELIKRTMEMPIVDFAKVFDGAECLEDIRYCEIAEIQGRMKTYESTMGRVSTILVGDEVKDPNGIVCIVTNTDTAYHLLYLHNGKTWKAPKSTRLVKTGRHFAAIRAHQRDE